MSASVDEIIRSNSINLTLIALGILFVQVIISILLKEKSEFLKFVLFGTITIVVILNTLYLVSSTIYLNNIAISKGPVHYHADFRIFDCSREVELIDPEGLSNKVGTETLHEHNDKRIHIEGVIVEERDASIGRFFNVVGRKMTSGEIEIPTEDGVLKRQNGDLCPDGSSGVIQVFRYKTDPQAKTFIQEKLADPINYVISPYGQVPPGDCIIVEFGPQKEKTEYLCEQYQLKMQRGELNGY